MTNYKVNFSAMNFNEINAIGKSALPQAGTSLIDPAMFGADFDMEVREVQKHLALTKQFVRSVVNGTHKNAILQGPPGLGKSHVVTQVLHEAGKVDKKDYFVVKGHITPTNLFVLLGLLRNKGQVLVLDDCDDVFKTELGFNLIKAALDPDNRTVSYQSQRMPLINGMPVGDFVYDGTLIICTNQDPRRLTMGRAAQHMAAVLSRAILWPLQWDTQERKFAQIYNMVVNADYLAVDPNMTLDVQQKKDLLQFIWDDIGNIQDLDLRLPQKIAVEMKTNANWRETCKIFMGI
jgi:Cdc6-like AAA superfamily ATPase